MSSEVYSATLSKNKSSRWDDVSLAWDSLHRAKRVFQKVESRIDAEGRRRAEALRVRRKLELDRSELAENSAEEIKWMWRGGATPPPPRRAASPVERAVLREKLSRGSPPGRGDHGSISLVSKEDYSSEKSLEQNSWTNAERHLCERGESDVTLKKEHTLAERKDVTEPSDSSYLRSPGSLNKRDCSREKVTNRTNEKSFVATMEELSCSAYGNHRTFSLRSTTCKRSPPCQSESHPVVPLGTPVGSYIQKLECLKSKSPERKLEKLKDLIRQQRRRLIGAPVGQHGSNLWQLRETVNKSSFGRKVRKVTFAPPPPVYRGFSSVNGSLSTFPTDEEVRKPGTECCGAPGPQNLRYRELKAQTGVKDQKQSIENRKQWSCGSQMSSSKLRTDNKKEKDSVSKLYGASAWREGQKLVRKLLGPPVSRSQLISLPKNALGTPDDESAPVMDDPLTVQNESNTLNMRNLKPGTNPKVSPALQDKTVLPTGSKQSKDPRQVLKALHSQNQSIIHGTSRIPEPLANNSRRAEEDVGSLEGCEGSKIGVRQNPRTNRDRRATSAPPKGHRSASSSPVGKQVDKENLQSTEIRRNPTKVRSYSVEEVREYMNRKAAERLQKEMEAKRDRKKAIELKNKRMEELFKKQKDAVPVRPSAREHVPIKPAITKKDFLGPNKDQLNANNCARSMKNHISEWVELTSRALLKSEGSESRDLNAKKSGKVLAKDIKTGPGFPSVVPPDSSPLKLNDLDIRKYSPPKNVTFLMKTNTKSITPEGNSEDPLYRSKEDRILAIHAVAKELEERIQVEAIRMRLAKDHQHQSDKSVMANELDSLHNSLLKPDKFQNELSRMLSQNSPLLFPGVECLEASSNPVQGKIGSPGFSPSRRRAHRTIGKDTPDMQQMESFTHTSMSALSSDQLSWNDVPEQLENGSDKHEAQDILQDKLKDLKISAQEPSLQKAWSQEPPPVSSPGSHSLGRSPLRKADRNREHGLMDASPDIHNVGDVELSSRLNKSAVFTDQKSSHLLEAGSEIMVCDVTDDAEKEDTSLAYLRESDDDQIVCGNQTSLQFVEKLKARELQQEREIALIRQKVELETQETQRSLDVLRRSRMKSLDEPKKREMRDGGEKLTVQKFPGTAKHMRPSPCDLNMERELHVLTAEETSKTSSKLHQPLVDGHKEPTRPVDKKGSEILVTEDSGDSSEPTTDTSSKWSDICQYYGGPHMFSRFTLQMAQQYLRDEELRARHQTALLRLREEALKEKTLAELAWLEHQKTRYEDKGDYRKVSDIVKKQQEILTQLQQEQTEISHLQNIYKSAHQERKLLLKHQKELLHMQQSTAHLQQKLQALAGRTQIPAEQEATSLISENPFRRWTTPILPKCEIQLDIIPVSETEIGHRNKEKREDKEVRSSHPLKKDTGAPRHRVGTEELQEWKPKAEEAHNSNVLNTVATMPHDSAKGLTGLAEEEASAEDQEIPEEFYVSMDKTEASKSAAVDENIPKMVQVIKEVNHQEHTEAGSGWKEPVSRAQHETGERLSHCTVPGYHSFEKQKDPVSVLQVQQAEDSQWSIKEANSPTIEVEYSVPGKPPGFPESIENLRDQLKANDVYEKESTLNPLLNTSVQLDAKENTSQSSERDTEEHVNKESELHRGDVKEITKHEPAPLQDVVVVTDGFEKDDAKFSDSEKAIMHLITNDNECPGSSLTVPSEPCSSSDSISNSLSSKSENMIFCPSLSEFQKVSAIRIDISGSSASLSGLDNAEDTDISDSEVFNNEQKSCEQLSKTQIKSENELLPPNKSATTTSHKCKDRTSLAVKEIPKVQDPSYRNTPPPKLYLDVSLDNINQPHEPLKDGMIEGQCSKSSEDFKRCSQGEEHSPYLKDDYVENVASPAGSLLYSSDFSETFENLERQASTPLIDKGEYNCEDKVLSSDNQATIESRSHILDKVIRSLEPDFKRPEHTITPQPKTPESKMAPIASDPEDLSLSDDKSTDWEYLINKPDSGKAIEVAVAEIEMSQVERASSAIENPQTKTLKSEKYHPTLHQASTERENKPVPHKSSEDLFPHLKNLPQQSKEDITFITDEVLLPIDADTLSEILSPLDEVLSYGSSEFPSTKKDVSGPSDDLPSFPDEISEENDDLSHEDFPSPPEDVTLIKDECTTLDNEGLRKPLFSFPKEPGDNVPSKLMVSSQITQFEDENSESNPFKQEYVSQKNENSTRQGEEGVSSSLQSPTTYSRDSGFRSQKNPSHRMSRTKKKPFLILSTEQDDGDMLSSFEIGDRVLVKHTQPGTLKFKGMLHFDEGLWAGVCLDKPDGDHDGTYEGVKYFECMKGCGVFVQPHQISRLLGDEDKSFADSEDEDSFFDGPAPGSSNKMDYSWAMFSADKTKESEQGAEDTSSSNEKMFRSQKSMATGITNNTSLCQDATHSTNEASALEFSGLISSVHESFDRQDNGTAEQVSKDATLQMNYEKGLGKMTNNQVCLNVLAGRKEKLADELSTQILRELLCDAFNVLSEISQLKHKCAIEGVPLEPALTLNSTKVFIQEANVHSPQSEAASLNSLVWDAGTFTNPNETYEFVRPKSAAHIEESIVAKFIDDAVKEYKKIKRKQGGNDDGVLGSSKASLPFLKRVLDAGVFGGSDFLDQSVTQPTEESRVPNVELYALDRWCTSQWKSPKELPLVVPHNAAYVNELVTHVVDELWVTRDHSPLPYRPTKTRVPECDTLEGNHLNAESKRMYNQSSVQAEILRLLNLEQNDLEIKRKLCRMLKVGSPKRDRVDILLIQELHQEEQQWTDYTEDEQAVKVKLSADILDCLLQDTIGVLNTICIRRIHQ
ncbi:coiled-coil domain-containing protein 187 isoform X1 [Pleurodeles waltl]|uniref:coiled-coil domain-containing protein 187 isoform X1 n=1 Tax=Pleurodeles waltl TaxID=8319 RepID=UPI0037096AA3